MVTGKELAQPVFQSSAGGRRLRRGGGCGATHRVGLGLAAEPAEVGIRLDRPAALTAEYGPGFRRSVGGRQGGPIIGPAIGGPRNFKTGVTNRPALPFDR